MLRTDLDVAVLVGDGRFKQGESHWLFNEEVFPVCSPQLVSEHSLPLSAKALLDFPLLHLRGENSSNWQKIVQMRPEPLAAPTRLRRNPHAR